MNGGPSALTTRQLLRRLQQSGHERREFRLSFNRLESMLHEWADMGVVERTAAGWRLTPAWREDLDSLPDADLDDWRAVVLGSDLLEVAA